MVGPPLWSDKKSFLSKKNLLSRSVSYENEKSGAELPFIFFLYEM
jgi:hypothetical protein